MAFGKNKTHYVKYNPDNESVISEHLIIFGSLIIPEPDWPNNELESQIKPYRY